HRGSPSERERRPLRVDPAHPRDGVRRGAAQALRGKRRAPGGPGLVPRRAEDAPTMLDERHGRDGITARGRDRVRALRIAVVDASEPRALRRDRDVLALIDRVRAYVDGDRGFGGEAIDEEAHATPIGAGAGSDDAARWK